MFASNKVFDLRGRQTADFFAYPGELTGVDLVAGDILGDGRDEIAITKGPSGTSYVKIFDGGGSLIDGFEIYSLFRGGTRVDVADVLSSVGGSKQEIITSPWNNGGPDIRVYNASGGLVRNNFVYEEWWSGQFDVAGDVDRAFVSTGDNRRSSIRTIDFRR